MSSKYKSRDKLDDVSHILVSNNLGIFGSSEFRLNDHIDNGESQIPVVVFFLTECTDSSFVHPTELCVYVKVDFQYLHRKDLESF